jgi:hypothetical protein
MIDFGKSADNGLVRSGPVLFGLVWFGLVWSTGRTENLATYRRKKFVHFSHEFLTLIQLTLATLSK